YDRTSVPDINGRCDDDWTRHWLHRTTCPRGVQAVSCGWKAESRRLGSDCGECVDTYITLVAASVTLVDQCIVNSDLRIQRFPQQRLDLLDDVSSQSCWTVGVH